MKNVYFTTKTGVLALMIGVVAIVVVGYQNVQAAFKKAAADGRSIRVSEVDSCPTEASSETAQFSGCNSIL